MNLSAELYPIYNWATTTDIWTKVNSIVPLRQIAVATDATDPAKKLKIGDGVTRWLDLPWLGAPDLTFYASLNSPVFTGKVGINQPNPTEALEVNGSIKATPVLNDVTQGTAAIKLNNSNISGVNAIVFSDESTGGNNEGLLFPHTGKGGSTTATDYDQMYVLDGHAYLYSSGVNHKLVHDGDLLPTGDVSLSYWQGIKTGVYFARPNTITGQPSNYGLVQVLHYGSDFTVTWFTQPSGAIYRLSGNGSSVAGWVPVYSEATLTSILSAVYPVGSIYMSVNPTNPATLFGFGTWVAWGSGRVPVGVDTSQAEFNAVEKTGGSKSNSYPHAHSLTPGTAAAQLQLTGSVLVANSVATGTYTRDVHNVTTLNFDVDNTPTTWGIGVAGNTDSASINASTLQPYITCYMWKRTA